MKIYNTLSKKVETFIPNQEGIVKMYTCGPTVYHYAHLGNMRTYISEDILEKVLTYIGYEVKRVMNITDVGHLQSDGDTGEDKMSVASKRENKSSYEIADYYTKAFFEDCALLNIKKPEIISKATDNITEYIKLIENLISKDIAYLSNGNVYFDTSKFPEYYQLSGKNQNDLMVASREGIEEDYSKRNAFDFGLWFTNSKFKNQELTWNSPWGAGYPGWHIECSAIAIKYLGNHLDIHCGAEDAIFPHHSNEIAQSEAYLGHQWCKYWVHLAFLNNKNEKMSKSKGDTLRSKSLIDKGFNPLSYRYFILSTHYRKQVNFSFESLEIAQSAYIKLKTRIKKIKEDGKSNKKAFEIYDNKFVDALKDDLNTSNALTTLYDLLKDDTINGTTKLALIASWDKVLSLNLIDNSNENEKHEKHEFIIKKIEERNLAKSEKNYILADNIREELLKENIELIDTKEGTIYKLKEVK